MSPDFTTHPIAAETVERLAADGLRFGLVDTADIAAFDAWLQADTRGFHGERFDAAKLAELREMFGRRRTTGVWDASSVERSLPIATVNSWPVPLTVPGARDVAAWAISSVTVAPTHRRRGIARALLETELRTASDLGVPVAVLTVSESTIYERFGFAPAVVTADLAIDTHRATWTGPVVDGRVHFVPLDELKPWAESFFERERLAVPGAIQPWEHMWNRIIPTSGEGAEKNKALRGVRYHDENGEPQGFAVYTVKDTSDRFSHHTLELGYLQAATDEAYAGLWRYLLEVDLVHEITAPLRPLAEALPWMVSDFRAVRTRAVTDHLWVRVLDVRAALEARSYAAPGRFALRVTDPLGYAEGLFLLEVAADGRGRVTSIETVPDDAASLSLQAAGLGALYFGGVGAATLVAAGRIGEHTPGAAVALDASLRPAVTPWLSFWF